MVKVRKRRKSGDVEKLLALTFDDGPHAVYTKRSVEGLQGEGSESLLFW